jgi:hypothetical protein
MRAFAIQALHQIEASAARGIWDAHQGCAALAGALLIQQCLVAQNAKGLIEKLARLSIGSFQGDASSTKTIPRGPFAQKLLHEIGIAAQDPKQLGHDVIYSGYVLRALDVFRIVPMASLLESLISLVRQVKRCGPGWITVNGKNEIRPLTRAEAPTGTDYWALFSRFERPLAMEQGDMQLGHLLTHGHAIEMLRHYGSATLLSDLDIAYRKRLHGLRTANGEERNTTPLKRTPVDPRLKRYWDSVTELGDMHGHVLKYAYSFLDLNKNKITNVDLQAYGRIVWPGHLAA